MATGPSSSIASRFSADTSRSTRTADSKSTVASIRSKSRQASNEDMSDTRPPTAKRVRKAVNCEPCRHSKLKCDRNRPCSSCVLRGTTALCYQGPDAPPSREPQRVDPVKEFSRIRHSLSTLEKHFIPGIRQTKYSDPSTQNPPTPPPKLEPDSDRVTIIPGLLGLQGQDGYYTGPTSTNSHLATDDPSDLCLLEQRQHRFFSHEYDHDLIELLPPTQVMDGLIDYYFSYCDWIHRIIIQATFLPAWQKYKTGMLPDRLVLATACILITIAIRYLPVGHELLSGFPPLPPHDDAHLELSLRYYDVMKKALRRNQDESTGYSLDLVELLLLRCHYVNSTQLDPEEIWSVKGELVTMATAMGLHRDPGPRKSSDGIAERRRWAWWHIHVLDRWQAFMFGRPISLPPHHFNTKLPSHCDPAVDPTGRLHSPTIALFTFSGVLGDMMDDAVSLRPIPYESTLAKDRLLTNWLNSLPPELSSDEEHILRNVTSPSTAFRRLGVQTVAIISSYYHTRFTLHRPHALPSKDAPCRSLDIAVDCAEKLISLAIQTGPDVVDPDAGVSCHAVPHIYRHLNWRPLHIFSAAMFFTFQLIRCPEQPGARRFKSCIDKALRVLNAERPYNTHVVDKALKVLMTLAPLYSEKHLSLDARGRQQDKAAILARVKTLAFPYQHPPAYSSMESPLSVDSAGSLPYIGEGEHAGGSYGLASSSKMSREPNDLSYGATQSYMTISNVRSHADTELRNPCFIPGLPQQRLPYETSPPSRMSLSSRLSDIGPWGGAIGFAENEWVGLMSGLRSAGGP